MKQTSYFVNSIVHLCVVSDLENSLLLRNFILAAEFFGRKEKKDAQKRKHQQKPEESSHPAA